MGATTENEKLDGIGEELLNNLQRYREVAENIIMNPEKWRYDYRESLKPIVSKIFKLQVKLTDSK